VYKPKDLNLDWSPRFSTLWDKIGWIRANNGRKFEPWRVSKPFLRFLAYTDSRNFSRFLHQHWPEQVEYHDTFHHNLPMNLERSGALSVLVKRELLSLLLAVAGTAQTTGGGTTGRK
jgi:hypothetical protein